MSMTLSTAVLGMLGLALSCFLLGLLFFGKLKIVRNFIWIVVGVFLLLTASIAFSHHRKMKAHSQVYTGTFLIDTQKSLWTVA